MKIIIMLQYCWSSETSVLEAILARGRYHFQYKRLKVPANQLQSTLYSAKIIVSVQKTENYVTFSHHNENRLTHYIRRQIAEESECTVMGASFIKEAANDGKLVRPLGNWLCVNTCIKYDWVQGPWTITLGKVGHWIAITVRLLTYDLKHAGISKAGAHIGDGECIETSETLLVQHWWW